MYPQIDILRISIIFTDTDSNFFVCMDTDTKSRIFYRDTLRLYFISFQFYFYSLLSTLDTAGTGTMDCKLLSYRVSKDWAISGRVTTAIDRGALHTGYGDV